MYKCNMELARINRYMKLKFNLVLIDDKEGVGGNKNATKVIDVFKLKGNDYLRLNPKPYITIDISGGSDKSDGYNANTLVNLTSVSLFNLMEAIKRMLAGFKIKDLYYIKDNKLVVNKKVSIPNSQLVRTPNKAIKLQHVVVYDGANREVEYEGIVFMINSPDNYCTLSYSELKYLYYELTKINLNELALGAINTFIAMNPHEKIVVGDPRTVKIEQTVTEPSTPEYTSEVLPLIESAGAIPDIL